MSKHTDPKELSDILEKVYYQMVMSQIIFAPEGGPLVPLAGEDLQNQKQNVSITEFKEDWRRRFPEQIYHDSFYEDGTYAVNPKPVQPNRPKPPKMDPNMERKISL